MIPLRDDGPQLRPPLVTIGLMISNVSVWLLMLTLSRQQEMYISYTMGVVPAWLFGPHPVDLPFSPWFSLITYQFLHGGFWHLLGNMVYLWIFGSSIEDALGHMRYLVFYLVGGVLAGLLHVVTDLGAEIPMIGASGSIAAVLGAYLVLYPRRNILILIWFFFFVQTIRVPAILALGIWFFMQILGSGDGVAWMAHIGGFVMGLLMVRFFLPRARTPKPPGQWPDEPPPTIH